MRIKKIELDHFKRFTNLTIDLGGAPYKIIVLVGPNGCGKSSVFDAIEEKAKEIRGGSMEEAFLSKGKYVEYNETKYARATSIKIETVDNEAFNKTSIYFRSAYRFTPRIMRNEIKAMPNMEDDPNRPNTSIDRDSRLEDNYSMLIGNFFGDVYNKEVSGKDWCTANINKLNEILRKILDITISNLGNPVEGKGTFFFNKGTVKNLPYNNLSSGEKEALDILLDFFIKTKIFNNTIFCLDEPELHLNTSIQRSLLIELEKLVPDNCQLWIATHSIGFLKAIQDDLKDKSMVIDMNNNNFDLKAELSPIKYTRVNWQEIFKVALEDLTGLVSPKRIVYCEGSMKNSIDESIFNMIFSSYHDTLFVSATNKTEALKYAGIALAILSKAFDGVELIVLIDRDDDISLPRSDVRIAKLNRREFENYLFDFEIISKAYPWIQAKDYNSIVTNIIDADVKSKGNNIIDLVREKNLKDLKINLGNAITRDTKIYKELEKIIFGAFTEAYILTEKTSSEG
jgi:predicted ATPase